MPKNVMPTAAIIMKNTKATFGRLPSREVISIDSVSSSVNGNSNNINGNSNNLSHGPDGKLNQGFQDSEI